LANLTSKNRFYGTAPALVSVLFFSLTLAASAFAQSSEPFSINKSPLPPPTGFVNDIAGVIDSAAKAQLETKLKQFSESTQPKVELAVAVVRTTGDRDISDYSLAVARGWKIGSKDSDNPSALLFIAVDDRKYYTQVSRDLEDELPDSLVGTLQRQYLVPEFKKGNYGKGISDTIDAYINAIKNKGNGNAAPQPTAPAIGRSRSTGGGSGLFCCAIILIVILIIVFTRSKGGGSGRGGWGGGGGGFGAALPWIIGSIISSSASGRGSSSGGWGGSSGGWGGSSGGGFGGFGGGGDFGGGGSGGSW
jgi:uncharacterized protein